MNKNIDFLAIGDIVTDAFIELEDAWVETDNPEHTKELCMRFGDKIPYKSVVVASAVGNSPNAAVSAKRLGLETALMTDLGDDDYGKEMQKTISSEEIPLDFVHVHAGKPSNYHYVLRFKAERTILVRHEEYDRHFTPPSQNPKWIYLSSLGGGSENYHDEIADYLQKNPDIKLAFQPGTFQMKMGAKRLEKIYRHTEVFFCNKEEAQRILEATETDMKKLLAAIRTLGPKIVVITDGPEGAYTDDGKEQLHIDMYPDPMPPRERTGAGDAFASTFTSALILGKSIGEALQWGPINSAYVVQQIGAQKGLLSREKLEEYIKNAPATYLAKII